MLSKACLLEFVALQTFRRVAIFTVAACVSGLLVTSVDTTPYCKCDGFLRNIIKQEHQLENCFIAFMEVDMVSSTNDQPV